MSPSSHHTPKKKKGASPKQSSEKSHHNPFNKRIHPVKFCDARNEPSDDLKNPPTKKQVEETN